MAQAPGWARAQWQRYRDECERWCHANRVPFTLTGDAHIYEERSPPGYFRPTNCSQFFSLSSTTKNCSAALLLLSRSRMANWAPLASSC
jgi:hypothetical protein